MGDERRRGSRGRSARPIRASGAGRLTSGPAEPDLLAEVRRGMKSGQPTDLLLYVSTLMAALDRRSRDQLDTDRAPASVSLSLEELAATLANVEVPETSALLAVVAAMSPDDLVRARARRALARRDHPLPGWLGRLGETVVYRAAEMTHVLGDGDNIVLGFRLAAGHELSVVVYVDHNLGTLVKDAFVVAEPIAALIEFMQARTDDSDLVWQDISLASARTKIARAIECGAMTYPPLETQTWPACRPLVEWLLRSLPAGGPGYVRPQWSEPATKELSRRFFASSHGVSLNDAEHRDLLESVLWFGIDSGPGDPMRWSPVNVELLLMDWIPRKVVADAGYLSKVPDLLTAFVRFCHGERGIGHDLTMQTLASVRQYAPEYQRIIRSPRSQGPAALLAAMGVLGDDGAVLTLGDDPLDSLPGWGDGWGLSEDSAWDISFEERVLARLAAAVGGEVALAQLDDLPLPDEDFDDSGVAADLRPMVAEIAARCDKFCQDLGDRELRTACRRLLARAVAGNPDAFRRSARTQVAAATVCWAVGKANDMFGLASGGHQGAGEYGAQILVKDLMRYFGLRQSSVSQRADVLLGATCWFGAPSLLTSSYRRHLIGVRDRYTELLAIRASE